MQRTIFVLIMLTAAVFLSAGILIAVDRLTTPMSPEARESARLEAETALKEAALQKRVDLLAADGCQSQVEMLFAIHAKKPVEAVTDIPAQLRDDLTLCLDRRIMYTYEFSEMRGAGMVSLLSTPKLAEQAE